MGVGSTVPGVGSRVSEPLADPFERDWFGPRADSTDPTTSSIADSVDTAVLTDPPDATDLTDPSESTVHTDLADPTDPSNPTEHSASATPANHLRTTVHDAPNRTPTQANPEPPTRE